MVYVTERALGRYRLLVNVKIHVKDRSRTVGLIDLELEANLVSKV